MKITDAIYWGSSVLWALVAWFLLLLMTPEPALDDDAPGGVGGRRTREGRSVLLRLFYPLIRSLSQLVAAIPMGRYRENLRKKLVQAGSPGGLNVDEFNATRIVTVVIAFLAGSFIDSEVGLTPVLTMSLTLLGAIYPDMWLNGAVQKRKRRLFRDLPDVLDMLRLAIDAGLDLHSAMKVVVEKGRRGPLLDEFERIERDVTLGRTRKEAFKGFADRVQLSEISSFVLALVQADQLGASIGPVLKVQADVARTRRWQQAEVIVNKMPMKMLGPLVALIFPASFIILFTPLIIQYFQSTE